MRICKIAGLLSLFLISHCIVIAQKGEPSQISDQKIKLNGVWKFNQAYNNDITKAVANTKSWKDIRVPGEWIMQDFVVEPGEAGVYFRTFFIPKSWDNKEVFIRCDAMFSYAEMAVNGKLAGSFDVPMVAFDIPIGDFINFGQENQIAIAITAETMSDTIMSGQQYAAHQMGGILRKIYIYALPKTYISNLAITTDLDENYLNANLNIQADVHFNGKSNDTEIEIALYDKGIELSKTFYTIYRQGNELRISIPIENPKKWTAESPKLYDLIIRVKSKDGEQKIKKKVGFREILIVGNQLFVNGTPIKLKGVNRHEVHPLLGRSLNEDLWKQDAIIFKGGNVNYIRTSHYPPSEEFISYCDSIGLYVELENPICWVGHGANGYWLRNDINNQKYYDYFSKVSKANIAFFRNHPSILIWSMANESVWTANWSKVADDYANIDPSRPASFHDQSYGGYNNHGSDKMPVASIHYPGPNGARDVNNFNRPILFGEYAHLNTYNRGEIVADPGVRDAWGRGFKSMWEEMYHSRGCLGGAIWSGIDDVFHLPGNKIVGYGEWGPIDGWRREKPEYFHMKKSYSPVKIHQTKIDVPAAGKAILLQVENRFDFTNLNECVFSWQIDDEKGSVEIKNIPPHQFGFIEIKPLAVDLNGKILKISIISPQNIEVDAYAIEIGEIARNAFPFEGIEKSIWESTETDKDLMIIGANYKWHFNKETGSLSSVEIDGQEILFSGANLMALALKTDACSPEHKAALPPLNNVYKLKKLEICEVNELKDTIQIHTYVNYSDFEGTIDYLFLTDGSLIVEYEMKSKIEINPRQWGLVFNVDSELQNLQWDRKGLWSWYPNNHIGRAKGSAVAFRDHKVSDLYQKADKEWFQEFNALGSNDFRSTKENIYWATLTNNKGKGISILSDGSQAFRAFVNEDHTISFLVAGYSTGGGDLFFSSHYADERKPIKMESIVKGSVCIKLNKSVLADKSE